MLLVNPSFCILPRDIQPYRCWCRACPTYSLPKSKQIKRRKRLVGFFSRHCKKCANKTITHSSRGLYPQFVLLIDVGYQVAPRPERRTCLDDSEVIECITLPREQANIIAQQV